MNEPSQIGDRVLGAGNNEKGRHLTPHLGHSSIPIATSGMDSIP